MNTANKRQFLVTDEILASHRQRLLNWFVDILMQTVLLFIILTFISGIALSNGNKTFVPNLIKNDIAQLTMVYCLGLFYYNFFEIFFARTIGKLFTQTVVVDKHGEKPHHELILIRTLIRLVPFEWVYYVLLYFMQLPAQGLHDSVSKTYVVDKRKLAAAQQKFFTIEKPTNEE